ncbi:MAG: NTP transferase domain-containing protein, partial [Nitrospinaceae bacterium]|nr:NTP transferase domain-containing protein [Nitrospinaceae bacterium]NIR56711.1 NTP transferase domain-containing protein [Nitrospinaceae bacterium]NIS85051.1 NTP transferase domain-containing protein [Nitrospinaceae bacterium]NIT84028.1 NTP transferase domain-containing protein [Nitrospinaceae bacterium]NIU46212.1 NTP transferase domain-containing protein [Nitrospinaceae bacterium]
MPGKELAVLILAAGKGTRMRSDRAKVLHLLDSRPLLIHVLDTVAVLKPRRIIVVVGHQAGEVQSICQGRTVEFVEQRDQLGTGHAVLQAQEALSGFEGDILILCGDMPLLQPATLQGLIQGHRETRADCTLLSLQTEEKKDFGRVVRDPGGRVMRIVEHKDASAREKTIDEYNSGIYCFNKASLFKALGSIDNRNTQGEYY